MIKRIILAVTAGSSIIGLAFINGIPLIARIVIVVIGILCISYIVYSEMKENRVNEKVCRNDAEIKDVMKSLVISDGIVAIMSRDLSWVDDELELHMRNKGDNMIVCVHKESDLTKRLEQAGVVVSYYGHIGFEPVSRFTIIRYNKKDRQVAIANTESTVRNKSFKHTIYQTLPHGNKRDEWIDYLATDMINLCKLIGEKDANDKTRS